MKKLEKIIKEAILEVLAEADISSAEKAAKDAEVKALQAKKKAIDSKLSDVSAGRDSVLEMARIPVQYKIGNLSKLSTLSDKDQNSKWTKGIIDYLKEKGQSDITKMAKEKFDRPQMAIADLSRRLVASGVLEPVGGTGIATSRISKTGTVAPPTTTQRLEPEDFMVGKGKFGGPAFEPSDEEVAASFARARAAGDGSEEEFVANLKKDAPKIKPSISDEDYDKLMKFLDYKERLRKIDSALRQNKKLSRGGDDMISKDRGEAEKLSNMKTDLENRIDDLVAGSEYLQRRKAPEDKNKNR
jgi:cell division protein FtsB